VTSVTGRREKFKSPHRCIFCLNRGHNARACNKRVKASCMKCRGMHHKFIYNDAGTTTRSTETATTTAGRINVAPSNFTNFQTAMVRIVGPTGLSKITRCVLDSGGQTIFVRKTIIDALNLDVIDRRNLAFSAFESSTVRSGSRRLLRLDLRGIWTNINTTITAFESDYEFLPRPTVPRDIHMTTHTRKLQFADPRKQEDPPI
jgi:hypothetical protein